MLNKKQGIIFAAFNSHPLQVFICNGYSKQSCCQEDYTQKNREPVNNDHLIEGSELPP